MDESWVLKNVKLYRRVSRETGMSLTEVNKLIRLVDRKICRANSKRKKL